MHASMDFWVTLVVSIASTGLISRILFLPDVKKKMEDIAVEVARLTPEELGTLTHNDAEKWGKLIKELGVTAQ